MKILMQKSLLPLYNSLHLFLFKPVMDMSLKLLKLELIYFYAQF